MLRRAILLLLFAFVAVGFAITDVQAAQRTFVSSTGVDNLNCSLASPCRTLGAAVTAVNGGGEVIALDSGGYGPVTINKSVMLIASPGVYAGITVFSGDGITVNAPGAAVVVRGFSIVGLGGLFGINFQQAASLLVESVTISNMQASGIVHSAAGGALTVRDTTLRGNGGSGVHVTAAGATVVINRANAEQNVLHGLYIASAGGEATATIAEGVFGGNGANGVWVDDAAGSTTRLQIERSVMAENGNDGLLASCHAGGKVQVTVTRNAIHHNLSSGVEFTHQFGCGLGSARGQVTENLISGNGVNAILGDGGSVAGGVQIFAGLNTLSDEHFHALHQLNQAQFFSHSTNMGENSVTGTISPISTF